MTDSGSGPTDVWWDGIGHLWDRSTGGTDVAAMPDQSNDFWPTAPRVAGLEVAMRWFTSRSSPLRPAFLFLVGGPGAGKSHAASAAVAGLASRSRPDPEIAERVYEYDMPDGRGLRLVNDASIPDQARKVGALHGDIGHVIGTNDDLLVCVNRGVLVEEFRTHGTAESDAVVKWLTSHPSGDSSGSTTRVRPVGDSADYMKLGQLVKDDEVLADLIAVNVDVCSLLEQAPGTHGNPSRPITEAFALDRYIITASSERSIDASQEMPANALLTRVVEELAPPSSTGVAANPITANLQSLRDPLVRTGLLTMLRASEIVSGKRMTYRELWGAVVRAIVGDLPNAVSRSLVRDEVLRLQPTAVDPVERLTQFLDLAELRYSSALFSRSLDASTEQDPVLGLTTKVDPSLDSRPGQFDTTDISGGWSTPIDDAFSTPIQDRTPLEGLLDNVGAADALHLAVTQFDRDLDQAYEDALMAIEDDAARSRLIRRYGLYLTRLYACANGIPAFRWEVGLWTKARTMSPNIPDELATPMRTLLRPLRHPESPDSSSIIPVFDSRTNPIIGSAPIPRLALRTKGVEMQTSARSDEISLVLTEHTKPVAAVALDFVLIREAMACDADRPGFTELTETASPRLERFRSARLTSNRLQGADFCAVSGESEVQIAVTQS